MKCGSKLPQTKGFASGKYGERYEMNSRYEKLLEPGRIGSVKTRNRMIKSGAGMLMWHQDDVHMRPEVQAFY